MMQLSRGFVFVAAALSILCSGSVHSADSDSPNITVTATTEKPAGELRSVSPSDVRMALEKIRAERKESPSKTPAATPAALVTPALLPSPKPAKSEFDVRAETIKASLAQASQKSKARDPDLPDWSPRWSERQSTPARRGGYCEVKIANEWNGVLLSVVFTAADEKSAPIRMLISRPATEIIDLEPGTRGVTIEGWLPSRHAPTPIYRLDSKRFEKGERYTLRLPKSELKTIVEFLAETQAEREKALDEKEPNIKSFAPANIGN